MHYRMLKHEDIQVVEPFSQMVAYSSRTRSPSPFQDQSTNHYATTFCVARNVQIHWGKKTWCSINEAAAYVSTQNSPKPSTRAITAQGNFDPYSILATKTKHILPYHILSYLTSENNNSRQRANCSKNPSLPIELSHLIVAPSVPSDINDQVQWH